MIGVKWPGRMNVLIRFVVDVVADVNPDFSHIWVWCEESGFEKSSVRAHSMLILMWIGKFRNGNWLDLR